MTLGYGTGMKPVVFVMGYELQALCNIIGEGTLHIFHSLACDDRLFHILAMDLWTVDPPWYPQSFHP